MSLLAASQRSEALRTATIARRRVRVDAVLAWRIALPAAIGAAAFVWAKLIYAPESDPALHLALIKGIAQGHGLPTHLPYFPASMGEGGSVPAMFPYSYTPLYHLTGAAMYSLGGVNGVLLINSVAAAVVAALIYAFLSRREPWYVATAAAVLAFLPTVAISLFTQMFMEPAMIALYLAGARSLYIASRMRSARAGALAGACIGLAIGVRQVALMYIGVLVVLALFHLVERRCWRADRLRRELPWMISAASALAITAAPFLAYLVYVNGTIGYADIVVPGTRAALAVDPVANSYISGITKPDASLFEWVDLYRRTLLFNARWIPLWYQMVPLIFFAVGVVHLSARGGMPRYFAQLAVVQLVAELLLFSTVHASSRYVIVSQMLFHSIIPVGAYASARWCASRAGEPRELRRRATALAAAIGIIALVTPAVFSTGYVRYVRDSYELRDFRSRSYAEAAAWIDENTSEDAIILTPRTYTAELTFKRNIAWVTFFGNAWVIDAISTPDPATAHRILNAHGVDYVLIQAPPGVYIDRMPSEGMRSYLQFGAPENPYFTLQYVTTSTRTVKGERMGAGLRVYSVNRLEARR